MPQTPSRAYKNYPKGSKFRITKIELLVAKSMLSIHDKMILVINDVQKYTALISVRLQSLTSVPEGAQIAP